ncbi:MAG: hypothetical protein IAF38_20010 [Bacteroidia bacterium]|nr:hypothetical protein [Bacteroidia bacterium]
MKIIRIILLIAVCLGSVNMEAQKMRRGGRVAGKHIRNKVVAKKVIRRTALVLIRAHKLTKENKNYTGKLAMAVRHQRYARILYRKGNFARAIHQSRLSRRLAFLAIQANKGTVAKDEQLGADDNSDDKTNPTDAELEKELPADTVTDQELINSELSDIDLDDND